MAQPSFPFIAIASVLGAGTVIGVILMFTLGNKPEPQPAAKPAEDLVAQGGVRPAEYGGVWRSDLDPAAGDEPPVRLPDVRPEGSPDADEADAASAAHAPPDPKALEQAGAVLQAELTKDVSRQLDKQQSALKKACWKPSLTGGASAASYHVNASFDHEGNLVGVGISDVRGEGSEAAAAVGQCLRQQALALNVPPTGAPVSVEVALRLP